MHFSLLRVKDLQKEHLRRKMVQDEQKRVVDDDSFWDKVKRN